MSAKKILVRNTQSGVVSEMSPAMLKHPHWGQFLEEARTKKPVEPTLHKPREARKSETAEDTEPITKIED
jgi:hypothetical protein